MWLSNTAVKRPVFATMVISALIVFGAIAYSSLGINEMPEVDFPMITITSILPGADPETMETEVTDLIEEAGQPPATAAVTVENRAHLSNPPSNH